MAPKTQKSWFLRGTSGVESLHLEDNDTVPEVGDNDVLVKLHAASLNFRDLTITQGNYPFPCKDGIVPGSDGAGTVEVVGKKVKRFKVGDKVATLFNQKHYGGSLSQSILIEGLGGGPDGCFRQYGVFNEEGLIKFPQHLSFVEASTLPCAAVTAWNALFGLSGRVVKPGDVVLTQGTGGVSTFAIQFAKLAGATVISTTSSNKKVEVLKKLGADHTINYKEDTNWGETAKKLTVDGEGVDFIIEVGGPTTMKQSLSAVKIDGVIAVIGCLGGTEGEQPSILDCLSNICTVRGVFVGSRVQFGEMNTAIETHKIKPLVDQKVFKLEQLKEAYQYMEDQKHLGKICVTME